MAGHFPLSRIKEPLIFKILDKISDNIVNTGELVEDFTNFKVLPRFDHSIKYNVMKLPSDYVEDPKTERAFMVGNFDLMDKDMQDQDESLIKGIKLEVHFEIVKNRVLIKNVFWVA